MQVLQNASKFKQRVQIVFVVCDRRADGQTNGWINVLKFEIKIKNRFFQVVPTAEALIFLLESYQIHVFGPEETFLLVGPEWTLPFVVRMVSRVVQ